jgi:hypothetical protein
MATLIVPDYSTELVELARGSEAGCAVFEWCKLTRKQRNAIQSIMWASGKISGDIEYGNFIVRITKQKMVTVLQKTVEGEDEDIY